MAKKEPMHEAEWPPCSHAMVPITAQGDLLLVRANTPPEPNVMSWDFRKGYRSW